jgi:nitroreductase
VQNLLLAARAEGLGAVLTTYGLSDYDAFAKILALPRDLAAFAVIPVGYPLGKFGPVTRLPVDQVTRFDRWS